MDRLNASKGAQEYRVSEIFLSSTPETAAEARANAQRIVQQIRQGASLVAYARQFSEASTAAVGGDLGWVRAEQLPDQLAAVAQSLQVGQISDPVPVPGGFSIVALQDSRKVLTADPRDAVLSLKQLSIEFPQGMTRQQAEPMVRQLAQTAQTMGGCGRAEEAAAKIRAEVVTSDQVKVRDLPPALQTMLLQLSIGQATTPFGTFEEGVRVLVLCGRDDPQTSDGPSYEQVYAQLNEDRVNRRARRYLRDLRRDAVVDYR
jgi:peptidyl-prolyl cis-trans isomerase SurA